MKELTKIIKAVKKEPGIVVVMCECAFGDSPCELELMGKSIKEIVKAGGVVHIIK